MTINKAVSLLRTTIRRFTDDSKFTDEFLYGVLLLKRNKYMSQRFRKFYNISEQLTTTFCAPLIVDNSHDCDCVKVGCKVVKTKYQIPATLEGRNRDLIKVYTLGYKEIFPVSVQEQKSNQLDPIKAGELTYSFLNRKITLWNTGVDEGKKPLEAILVAGIWEDETEWEGITLCDELNPNDDITNDNCYDIDSATFAIEADLLDMVIQESLQHLGFALQAIEDNTNDANPNINA